MNIRKIRRAIRATAKVHGISETQAEAEIENMIRKIVEKARREMDEQTLLKWKKIPSKGDIPTAYELIDYLSEKLKEDMQS